ncbi:MAG: hypothetical protein GXY67_04965 [Clostridiales bacterium]|nr:hypothetical protein [Clostridiales bacterium]
MSNIGIVYATMTKHSAKLANAIGRALQLQAEDIKNGPQCKGLDLLFIVGGIYGGQSKPELLEYVKGLDSQAAKRVALVTSCTSNKQGQEGVRALLTEKGIQVVDEFICRGSFLFMGFGHPNRADVENAVRFACSLAGKAGIPA